MTANEIMSTQVSWGKNLWATKATTTPFPKSPKRVKNPAFFPDNRRTLVDPIFPLPALRGSWEAQSLEARRPKGIEPRR